MPAIPPQPQQLYDVIVVGAGVAGASLAISLARDGRSVLCIERTLYRPGTTDLVEPQRIVGELLQPGGYAKLHELGLADAVEGIDSVPIYGYGLFMDTRAARIGYFPDTNTDSGDENNTIPSSTKQRQQKPHQQHGCSFHNGRFLRRLREIARDTPNFRMIEGTVTALIDDQDHDINNNGTPDSDTNAASTPPRVTGVRYRDPTTGTVRAARAKLTVACDGCSSTLRRRAADAAAVDVYSNFHGLVLDMRSVPFPNHGHVVLADPSPVLFYPISSREVRCLVDVSSAFRGDVTEYMLTRVLPQVPEAFQEPFERAVRSGQSRMMPNRVMPAAAQCRPGAILLGDAFNMRHPLTGGGMTVALSDIAILRDELRHVDDLAAQDPKGRAQMARAVASFRERRKPLSTTINILANALYTLFCAQQDPALRDMRDACFTYITSGGRMTHDPMGMLGGLKPYRFLLVSHFFAVALYGCGQALLPWPTVGRACKAWSIFRASFNVIKPLIDAERLAPLSWIPFSAL